MTAPVVDWSEIRLRLDTVGAGVRLAFVMGAVGGAYAGATWSDPNRPELLAIFAGTVATGLAVHRTPTDAIVRSRWREPFFLAWTLVTLGLIAASIAADGGASSPLVLLLFPPLVFAALSYPLWSVVMLAGATELLYVGVATLGSTGDTARVGFCAAALAVTAVMCAWQAQTHDRRRQKLTEISRTDPLTGSLNRRGFEQQLDAEIADSTRSGQPLGVLMIDLDHFKQVNDTLGHAAGDELLCWTVATVRASIRGTDSIGRLGGDEFAVLLRTAGQAEAIRKAAQLREALGERVSAAVGVAAFPADGVDQTELLRRADNAVYESKGERRRYEPDTRRDLSWAAVMAHAVDLRMGGNHSARVAQLASDIAQALDWDPPNVALLRLAAMLHDIGNVSIPDGILGKPGPLSGRELEEVRRHSDVGAQLVSRVEGLDLIIPWIRHVHEHYDGTGYPDGLAAKAIPGASRILLVADGFVAMTAGRPYRQAIAPDAAVAELQARAGEQFDPDCVEGLARALDGKQHPGAGVSVEANWSEQAQQ
jgi:diguanylate cyclase (GGDEF)-like protein